MSDLPPELAESLRALVGTWRGPGHGEYPTVEPFDYLEEVSLTTVPGKPFLVYTQKTRAAADGRPLHAEAGYWRSPAPGRFEVVISHPFGAVEVLEGDLAEGQLTLTSTSVATTSSAKELTRTERVFTVDGDTMHYRMAMAAVGLPMTHHLDATLRREI